MEIGLSGNLDQELSPGPLKIQGGIPLWLKGTLVRNGPARFTAGGKRVAHWFDGLAMLHLFSFDRGVVTYANRFLRTPAYESVFKEDSVDYLGFAQDPCRSIFRRLTTAFFPDEHRMPNADVNVAKYGEAYVALTEIPLPVQFDPESLETLGVLAFKDPLPRYGCFESAHPHRDPVKKQTLNYIVKFGRHTSYQIYRMPDGSITRELIAEIPVDRPAYMHSFSVTENFVLITEYPLRVKPLDFLIKGKPFIENYVWNGEEPTNIYLICRKTGKVLRQVQTEPLFAFHHINAFEEGGKVILDLVGYPDNSIIKALARYGQGTPQPHFPQGRFIRFEIDEKPSAAPQFLFGDLSFELPRIHANCDGKSYRYIYGVDLLEPSTPVDARGIYKLDLQTFHVKAWKEAGCFPGEALFIPDPRGLTEDDGVVASVVFDAKAGDSFLLLLDAVTFEERGRAIVPHAIPMGLHGQFFKLLN